MFSVLNFACIGLCLLVFSVQCQHFDEIHDPRIQEINYAKQFEHGAEHGPQQASSNTLNDDPLLRELFKEFLTQYQQIATEHQATNTPTVATTTTTTTTESPFKVQLSTFPSSHQKPARPIKPSRHSGAAIVPQRRRLSSGRKSNSPEAIKPTTTTTPFSTLIKHINFPHHEPALVETTTPFTSLKQKYFGINTQSTKRPALKLHQPVHIPSHIIQTTQTPQILSEEPVEVTTPPQAVSKFQILQSKLKAAAKATAKPKTASDFDEKEFRRQAESAKYEFASDVNDEINGNLHQREEIRDGLAVRGKYSYSDGYYKRTVHYEADDKGYRVVKEEVEPLVGPQANPDGQARVSSYVDGNTVNYQITKDDIQKKNPKLVFDEIDALDSLEDYSEEN